MEKDMALCPQCGWIHRTQVRLYDETLKKQRMDILPVHPTCRGCGSEVEISDMNRDGEIIVVNGTCGSGKSTVAEYLSGMGWYGIDGDCAIQTLRHRTGRKKYEWQELMAEIFREIRQVGFFGDRIVLSHVVLPEDLAAYEEAFRQTGWRYKLILLKPQYEAAAERCRTRKCHMSITPEEWIRHFYDALQFEGEFAVIDNTHMTVAETMAAIEKVPYASK